jgi:DNA-binding transcriptional ArsR family regulator
MASAGAPSVDDAFGVIAHPLRRTLLERLAEGESRVTELAQRLPVSRPAVSQHLRLMLDVGIVAERRDGRDRYYSLRRDSLGQVDRWLAQLDDLESDGRERARKEHNGADPT